MTTRISFRVVVASAIIIAAALTYAIDSRPADSAQQAPTPAEESAISHVAAFQQNATEEDNVPGETTLSGRVRRVGSHSARRRVWGSITATQDCVQVGEEGAAACAAPERLEQEPLIVGSTRTNSVPDLGAGQQRPPAEEWAGLVENDVETIEVTYADGTTEMIPVVDNGFYIDPDGREVKSFSWKTSDGSVHTDKEG
jgi:hypothetical protein